MENVDNVERVKVECRGVKVSQSNSHRLAYHRLS